MQASSTAQHQTGGSSKLSHARHWLTGEFWPTLKQAVSDWSQDNAMRLSAAVAMYSVLAIAPLTVVILKITSVFLGPKAASGNLKDQLGHLFGPQQSQAIDSIIRNASQPSAGIFASIISFIILLFSASGIFGELQSSLNTIFAVKPRPSLGWWGTVKSRFLSIGMVFVIVFLLLISQVVGSLVTNLAHVISGGIGAIAIAINVVVSIGVVTVLFALLFRYLPDARVGWREAFIGAFISAILFEIGQYLLAIYFSYSSPSTAYGAAGSIVAILLWVYYTAWILFFGAEYTQAHATRHGRGLRPTANAVKLTRDERANQGIVPEERLQHLERTQPAGDASAESHEADIPTRPAGAPANQPPSQSSPWRQPTPVGARRKYAMAFGALAVGYIAGKRRSSHQRHAVRRPAQAQRPKPRQH